MISPAPAGDASGALRSCRTMRRGVDEALKHVGEHPALAASLEASFIDTPVPKYILQQLNGVGFESVPQTLLDMGLTAFSVPQSAINEEMNGMWRDSETREQGNKRIALRRAWFTPTQKGLLDQRNEIPTFNPRDLPHHEGWRVATVPRVDVHAFQKGLAA